MSALERTFPNSVLFDSRLRYYIRAIRNFGVYAYHLDLWTKLGRIDTFRLKD